LTKLNIGFRHPPWRAASGEEHRGAHADRQLHRSLFTANGDDGAPRGRELEIARLLSEIKRHRLHNIVWLTADVHYTAA